MISLAKKPKTQPKNCSLQTRGFEQLSSAISGRVMPARKHERTAGF